MSREFTLRALRRWLRRKRNRGQVKVQVFWLWLSGQIKRDREGNWYLVEPWWNRGGS